MLQARSSAPGCAALLTLCAFGLTNQSADAARLLLEGPGTAIEIDSGIMAGTLDDGVQTFSAADLAFMQAELASDGIDTSGHISLLLAETGNGLAFVNLFDGVVGPPLVGGNDSMLGFNSLTSSSAERHWNTDSGGNLDWFDFGVTQLVDGTFEWQSDVTSEGFAWSNLQEGDVGTVSFVDLGLDQLIPDMMFQYITHNGQSWEVASYGEFAPGSAQYNLSFFVSEVPAPGALSLLVLSAVRRRRRR